MRTLYLLLALICLSLPKASQATELKSAVQLSNFFSPETGPYCEVQLLTQGSSVLLAKTESGKFRGSIQVQMAFVRNDSIINYKTYNLLSPEVNDSSQKASDFLDVQRFPLPPGAYFFEIMIIDNLSKTNPFTSRLQHAIPPPAAASFFSDIQLLESFSKTETPGVLSKSGFDLIPLMSDYFPEASKRISFYSEWYNPSSTASGSKMILQYYIENADDNTRMENYAAFKRAQMQAVVPLLASFDISDLNSGNYNLVIEARDAGNAPLAQKKIFFQRNKNAFKIDPAQDMSGYAVLFSGHMQNPDTLAEYIHSLRPISERQEQEFGQRITESKDLKKMQNFFYQFWLNKNSKNPQKAWEDYASEVKAMQQAFGTRILKGYQTDRGRVYLKYGKPDVRDVHENDAGLYPYEIWQYYKLSNRSNRKFVFYNPEIATNRWVLLHSDAIGERRDDRWQMVLQKRSIFQNNMDVQDSRDFFGNRIQENFSTPR